MSNEIQWGQKTLASHGYTLKSDSPIVIQDTPWSNVTGFETTKGFIYMKHTPELLALEAPITKILYNQFHVSVPNVIASNNELNCFLMEDAGIPLRALLKKNFDVRLLTMAVEQFISIRLSLVDHVDVFLDIGVPNWRINNLPDLYMQILSQKDILIMDGLTDIEITQLKKLQPIVSDLCNKLEGFAIKPSIVQPDFHDNNILIEESSKKLTFIDLGGMVISHPFFSLIGCLQQAKRHHALTEKDDRYQQLLNAILKPFSRFESEKKILEAFQIASLLQLAYQPLCGCRLMMACGKEKLMEFQLGKLSSSLKEFMAACTKVKDIGGL